MPTKLVKTITLNCTLDKETKNACRFEEQVAPDADFIMGKIYLKKKDLAKMGDPKDITVTITCK